MPGTKRTSDREIPERIGTSLRAWDGESRTVRNSPAFYKFTWGMSVIKDKFILLHSLKFVNNFCVG